MEQHLNNNYYETLVLPIEYNKNILEFTREEIKTYYQWFLSIKSKRLNHLCKFLFQDLNNCLNEENLKIIDVFLVNSIATVSKPNQILKSEQEDTPPYFKDFFKPEDYLFDKRTISICYDIGIYMGELIIKLDKKIYWNMEVDEEFVDYGQPIITKKDNKLRLNPFRVVKNMAAKIYEGTYFENELIEKFNVWKNIYKV